MARVPAPGNGEAVRLRLAHAAAYDAGRGTKPVEVNDAEVDEAFRKLARSDALAEMLAEDEWTCTSEDGETMIFRPPESPEVAALRLELQHVRHELAMHKRALVVHDGASVVAGRVASRGLLFALAWAVRAWWNYRRGVRALP